MIISEKLIINILFVVALLSQFLNSKIGMIEFNFIFMFSGFLLFFIRGTFNFYLMKTIAIILAFQFLSSLFSYRDNVGNYLFFISTILFGYHLSKVGIYKEIAISYFFCISFYFLYNILSGNSLNADVFYAASRNYISVYMVWASIILIISGAKRSVVYICLLLSLFICVSASGRSGIISSALLLFLYTILDKGKIKYIYILLVIGLASMFVNQLIENFDSAISRFEGQGLEDDGRSMVFQCYMDKLDLNRIMFGIDFGGDTECGAKAIGVYNLHNSFLSLSSYSGIGALFIFYLVIRVILKSSTDKNIILTSLLFCILVRSITDSIIFFFSWDYLFWVVFFMLMEAGDECLFSIK